MRLKKGFTLAEILIVLMVIGALATMTIPSLMKGVTEAQFKTGYRKALNAIINLTVMEKLSGNLPSTTSDEGACKLFDILSASLSVKAYVDVAASGASPNSGTTISTNSYNTSRPADAAGDNGQVSTNRYKNWIVTEDNFAYLVTKSTHGAGRCDTKLAIISGQDNNSADAAFAYSNGATNDVSSGSACYVIYVDVNGLSSGPNTIISNKIDENAKVPAVNDDTFPIYVGLDGSTAGNQKRTITGRIAADLK